MKPFENAKGIYWVGAVDWNVRTFHGHTYTTSRGTTYNAYLIVDEKIALVDTVLGSFAGELIDKISQIVPPEKIDYVVSNHVETDHSGAMPAIMKLCPKAKVYGTAKCKEGLYRHYYEDWDFQVVKTGDKLSLGKRTLAFVEARHGVAKRRDCAFHDVALRMENYAAVSGRIHARDHGATRGGSHAEVPAAGAGAVVGGGMGLSVTAFSVAFSCW